LKLFQQVAITFRCGFCSVRNGCIPVALSNSEGTGSVLALAWLPGAHLYIQVLGNEKT